MCQICKQEILFFMWDYYVQCIQFSDQINKFKYMGITISKDILEG